MSCFKNLLNYFIINGQFKLENLGLKEGYSTFLTISDSYDEKIKELKKLIVFYFSLISILFYISDKILYKFCLIISFVLIYFSYIGYKFYRDWFKIFVRNFIKFCKKIVRFENYVKNLIKFPNLKVNISKLETNYEINEEDEIKRFIFVQLRNLFDSYVKFFKGIKNKESDNLFNTFLISCNSIKLESSKDLLSLYRILTEIKKTYLQSVFKMFSETFSNKISFLFVFYYSTYSLYNYSLNDLISLIDESLNSFDDFFINSKGENEFELYDPNQTKHKRLIDVHLDTIQFYRKMSFFIKDIETIEKDEQSKSFQNLFYDITCIYNNFKILKENYIVQKSQYKEKVVGEENTQTGIEEQTLLNNKEIRHHLIELNLENANKNNEKKQSQQFSFNHFEMMKMEKESKIAQQEMLCELDDIFKSCPKSYTLEELLE